MTDDIVESEQNVIQTYLAPLAADYPGAFGLRDDCALFTPQPGHQIVLQTDPIVEGVHFFADDTPEDLAWKALAVNASDIVAKGALPAVYLLALAFPSAPRQSWFARFSAGLANAQATFGCKLAGGDTDRTGGLLSIAVTMIGEIPSGAMIPRGLTDPPADSAWPVYVTGSLGDAHLGLRLRQTPELAATWGLGSEEAGALVQRYLRPIPRLDAVPLLRRYATAAMDVSDGLVKDFARMCGASGAAGEIRISDRVFSPLAHKVLATGGISEIDLITAGDDYEILLVVPEDKAREFEMESARMGVTVTQIASIRRASEVDVTVISAQGEALSPARTGWDHL